MAQLKRSDIQTYINALARFRCGSIDDLNTLLNAVDAGVLALKCQEKKLPFKYQNYIPFTQHYRCPKCRGRLDIKDAFCRYCGQALKWK